MISPKYFNVINQVLASMIFESKYDKALILYIIKFLTKLIKSNYQFAGLILDSIDLRRFITINLLAIYEDHIQATLEFFKMLLN